MPEEARRRAPSGRFTELDGLRGLAVASVIAAHYLSRFDEIFTGHDGIGLTFPMGGPLGVDLFFMISGFVIIMTTKRRPSASTFALLRFARLFPPYWVCVTATALICWATDTLAQPWSVVAANYTMVQGFLRVRHLDGAYWSLSCELFFYALIAVMLLVCRREISTRAISLLCIGWTGLGLALSIVHAVHPAPLTHLVLFAVAGPFASMFSLGIMCYQLREGLRSDVWLPAAFVVVGFVNEALLDGLPTACAYAVVAVAFITVCLRPSTPLLRARPLVFVGSISYPLYLLHQNIGYVLILHTVDTLGPWLSRGLALLVVVIAAWAVHRLVEEPVSSTLSTAIRRRSA